VTKTTAKKDDVVSYLVKVQESFFKANPNLEEQLRQEAAEKAYGSKVHLLVDMLSWNDISCRLNMTMNESPVGTISNSS
jgi:hypothetical protein